MRGSVSELQRYHYMHFLFFKIANLMCLCSSITLRSDFTHENGASLLQFAILSTVLETVVNEEEEM